VKNRHATKMQNYEVLSYYKILHQKSHHTTSKCVRFCIEIGVTEVQLWCYWDLVPHMRYTSLYVCHILYPYVSSEMTESQPVCRGCYLICVLC
jgi:hypothetical protein